MLLEYDAEKMSLHNKKFIDELSYQIIGSAIEVHKALGPGLLENLYHKCMMYELHLLNIRFISEQFIEVTYKDIDIGANLRCDLLVEDAIVVELKAVKAFEPIHEAKLLTYMKLLEVPKGILINFNVMNIFKEGQKTMVNEFYSQLF